MYSQDENPSVTVISYSTNDVKENIVKSCLNEIQDLLIESQRFVVVEKAQRDILLIDEKVGDISECDFLCALDIGKSIGLDYIVTIEINNYNKSYKLDIDFISIKKKSKEIIKPTQIDDYPNLLTSLNEYGNLIVQYLDEIDNQPIDNEYSSNTFDQSIYKVQKNTEKKFTQSLNNSTDVPSTDLGEAFCCFWLLYLPYLIILGLLPPV